MKKIIAFILVMLMSVSCVSAAVPKFMTDVITNYTADYDVSIKFNSSEDITNLLREAEMPKEVEWFVNIEALLRTLLSYDGKMNVKVNMSDDLQKLQMAFTADSNHSIDVNRNLNIGIDAKAGMWMDMDLTGDEAIAWDVIYQQPFMDKYMVLDMGELMAEEENTANMFKMLYNAEYIESIQELSAELLDKYATIKGSGSRYTIKIDNDGLIGYIDELLITLFEMIPGLELEIPSLEGVKILGEEGITVKVVLSGGKLKTETVNAHICINLSEILGNDWGFEADGLIDFTISMDARVSNIGRTKVSFPKLTDENSIDIFEMMEEEPDYEYAEAEAVKPYPMWYVGEYCDYLPVIDGEVYVPLRQTIESVFEDSVDIAYDNGKITMTSEYFDGFKTMEFAVDSDKLYIDGTEYTMSSPISVNNTTTYVSGALFTEFLGWTFSSAQYDLQEDDYFYSFYTNNY